MKNAIRLTNKTARALKKSADRIRNAHFAAAGFFSAAMAVLAVWLGLKWLAAVPVTVIVTVFVDCLIVMRANNRHLSMLAQAICTEAAAREIRAGASESQRRQKAITDLINVKADIQSGQTEKKKPDAKPFFEKQDPDEDEEDDVRAKDIMKMKPVKAQNRVENAADNAQEHSPRRRRRKDGLKLIRGEQAR